MSERDDFEFDDGDDSNSGMCSHGVGFDEACDDCEDSQIDDYYARNGQPWPNCVTPDCKYKRCCWAGTEFCYPCSETRVGKAEMARRYGLTHTQVGRWTGKVFSEVSDVG